MSFSSIFKKASNLLGLGGSELKPPPLDGEIIYCKNNVCVHPPASLSLDTEHHPGYLTLRAQQSQNSRPTLLLTWIPNTTLKKNPHSLESSPNKSASNTPRISPRRNHLKQEFAKSDNESMTLTPSSSPGTQEPFHHREQIKKLSNDSTSVCSEASSYISSVSNEPSSAIDDISVSVSSSREDKLSSSYKSQTDSGVGSEGPSSLKCNDINPPLQLQNNEKNLQSGGKPPQRVGVRVNNLNSEKGLRSDMKNLELQKEPGPRSDDFTSEEQMVAMMNRNKLHIKHKDRAEAASKPVSITIKGDSLVVVTEQQANGEMGKEEDIDPNINRNESKFETSSSQSADNTSISSGSNNNSPSSFPVGSPMEDECVNHTDGLHGLGRTKDFSRVSLTLDLPQTSNPPPNTPVITPDISITKSKSRCSSSSSTTTSGPDSRPATPFSSGSEPTSPRFDDSITSPESPDSATGMTHNMTFPENAMSTISSYANGSKEKRSAKDQICGVFSVDLGQMRSLRLFYNDKKCTQGQVVIASRESQYKILHFHTGGLDKLAEIFDDWSLFAHDLDDQEAGDGDKPYRQFLVVKPHISDDQCHPEEHVYSIVTDEVWQEHMAPAGAFENVFQLRKEIFFGGLDPSIRAEVWPFLLHYYPFSSTFEDRERIRNDKYIEYQNIRKVRESMSPTAQQLFWKNIQCIVEKDVVRTDRSHPYFRGENNPNIEVLKNVLLNYAVANPSMGYTQGMSDLLAPILAAVQHEAESYWCFAGLMTRTIFVSSPKDSDMDQQLTYLRELLRITLPKFHYHLKLLGEDALELLFCHRWILLCFKREFNEEDVLSIWEACWSRYQTDYFHLFLCVAIVAIYGDDVVEQRLPADEILLHFSSLAMHMNGQLVLKKARGLLHEFRKRLKIPCTLYGLCSQVHAGMWDSGHAPTVECISHLENQVCPYNSTPSSPVVGVQ